MRILVVGDGKVGHTLAEHLAREGHDVVIVDRSEEVLQRSEDTLDVLCVRGNGANAATLVDAGADKADIIIAATASDETNMLCCLVAKKLGTKYSIARIRDPEYNDSLTLLQREMGITYLFVSHDLSMVRHISHNVGVMYLGCMVERAPVQELYSNMLHPYTQALMSAVPIPDPDMAAASQRIHLSGDVPTPIDPPSGCRFRARCPYATEQCANERPELREVAPDHFVACHRIK